MTQEAVVAKRLARGVGGPHWWLGWLEGGWLWARVVQGHRRRVAPPWGPCKAYYALMCGPMKSISYEQKSQSVLRFV